MAQANHTMKLLINGKSNKVLFAEAEKEVVDFLFSLLALPLGTITKLLKNESMEWCIGSLYQSLEGLGQAYLECNQTKTALLNPTLSKSSLPSTQLLPAPTTVGRYFKCSSCSSLYVTEISGAVCPHCKRGMTTEMQYVDPKATGNEASNATNGGGCVKGAIIYTIADDLTVTPLSAISSIAILNEFHIKDVSDLQEKTVTLGISEALKLLKASLQSKTVLTDTFLLKEKTEA